MKKTSDFIFEYLEKQGVKHAFMLSGGGIMHLVDSLGHSNMGYVCCHHEQAAAIAAQAYGMYKNELSVCLVTTGPGGTNALTGAAAAYVDSTPVLFLTGQVKRADFASLRGVRQFGAQENDIVSMAKPVTKYAKTVMNAEDILYHLQEAVYIATHGRKGPVWLDIPLDVQAEMIDDENLREFCCESEVMEETIIAEKNVKEAKKAADLTCQMLQNAKRPLLLLGHGVDASNSRKLLEELLGQIKIPVVCTWRMAGAMDENDLLFFGFPGLQARRYSNIITQSADCLIVLGSRLDNMITAFSEEHFAFRAKKLIVDIDEKEGKKLQTTDTMVAVCNVYDYLEQLLLKMQGVSFPDYGEWIHYCRDLKQRYPIFGEKQVKQSEYTDLYRLVDAVSKHCNAKDAIVASSTSRCNTASYLAFSYQKGQKVVSSMGMGAMGFALPSVVGVHFASGGRRVIMFEGDGSLQLNIQELQTLCTYEINAKMFIWSNTGYAAIATMQDRNFEGHHVGSDPESGVKMPDLEKIADAYGLSYRRILTNSDIEKTVDEVMTLPGIVICEVMGDLAFDEIPKCISSLDETGKRVSAALENPYPFLSEQEMEQIWSRMPE